jgi:hypothetical protein
MGRPHGGSPATVTFLRPGFAPSSGFAHSQADLMPEV